MGKGEILQTTGRVALAILATLCAALLWAGSAAAEGPVLAGSFDGTANSGPGFERISKLAVDEASGDIYVLDDEVDAVKKFNAGGEYLGSISGSSTGAGSFSLGGEEDIAVDNSGTATQGRVYVVSELSGGVEKGQVFAFDATGAFLWESEVFANDACGVAVDPDGNPWVAQYSGDAEGGVRKLDLSDGSRVAGQVGTIGYIGVSPCEMAFDPSGSSIYLTGWHGIVEKYANFYLSEDLGTFDSGENFDVAVDALTADVYTLHSTDVAGYDSSAAALEGTPFGSMGAGPDTLVGVTVDGAARKVYVSDSTSQEVNVYTLPPRPQELTVQSEGTGSGSVECDSGSGFEACATEYELGTDVTLTAAPAGGSEFVGWSGCDTVTPEETCKVWMTSAKSVTAYFDSLPVDGGGGGGGGTTGEPSPPPPPPVVAPPADNSAAYGQCVAQANKAFKRAKKAAANRYAKALKAARKHGGKAGATKAARKRKTQALKGAMKRHAKAVSACKAQFK